MQHRGLVLTRVGKEGKSYEDEWGQVGDESTVLNREREGEKEKSDVKVYPIPFSNAKH